MRGESNQESDYGYPAFDFGEHPGGAVRVRRFRLQLHPSDRWRLLGWFVGNDQPGRG